ncbi:hypothetical protein HZA38_00085 [Candidatus Peregrinibacteria bacterium]|nr:hypothetical protein [Candidatus Peregrinibacteria bacterium]
MTKSSDTIGFAKTYEDKKNGFEIQYPSFFTITGNPTIDSGNIIMRNGTCDTNNKLCFTSTQAIMLYVSDNKDNETLDEYYQNRAKDVNIKNLKKIKISPLPENFNEDEWIDAVRYEFDEAPKQQAGGYTYILYEKEKIFEITILSYVNYNNLLDDMMRTFISNKDSEDPNSQQEQNISEKSLKKDEMLPQITFDGCKKIPEYSEEEWYSGFKSIAQEFFSQISDACYSQNGGMLLSLVHGEYCESGSIYKYTIKSSSLEKATLNEKGRGCLAGMKNFGKREGNIIKMEGFGGDAGCSSKMFYDYDFLGNKVMLVKEYNICEGDKEGVWRNY